MSHDVVSLELSSFRILNTEYKFVWNLTLYYYVAWLYSIIHRGLKETKHRSDQKNIID